MTFEVIVGNIGTVYEGESENEAMQTYYDYRRKSIDDYGRAAKEPVTLLENGNIRKEHVPDADED